MTVRPRVRRRFWLEIAFVVAALLLWIATLVWPDWIELLFHLDPDEGDGSIERIISIALPAIGLFWLLVSGWEWRRAMRLSSAQSR